MFHVRCLTLVTAAMFAVAPTWSQRKLTLHPGESFKKAVESLQPGDHLTVMPGTYIDGGRIAIKVRGTKAEPVIISGPSDGPQPVIARSAEDRAQNTINIEGATWLTIRSLEITSNGGDGINLSKKPSHVTLEDLHIHDIDVGVNFRSDMHHINVRRCHIHDTAGTGEGMYVGCNHGKCVVRDCIIENNWIHDTKNSSQGDGIEVKRGSHSNIIRNNVIHDTRYPGILLYGTEGKPRNIVEGNIIWGAGDSGIQCAADAVIRNNVIFAGPGGGLSSQPHQGVTPGQMTFVHNTIVGGSPALRLSKWNGAPGMVFANNAIYAESGQLKIFGLQGVTFTGNVFLSPDKSLPRSGWRQGKKSDVAGFERRRLWPAGASNLINAADKAHLVERDAEGVPRGTRRVAGAYTDRAPHHPRWTPKPGFKPSR